MEKLARKAVARKLALTALIVLLGLALVAAYPFTGNKTYLYAGLALIILSPIISYLVIVWWFYRASSRGPP